jgi:hypothetical protein
LEPGDCAFSQHPWPLHTGCLFSRRFNGHTNSSIHPPSDSLGLCRDRRGAGGYPGMEWVSANKDGDLFCSSPISRSWAPVGGGEKAGSRFSAWPPILLVTVLAMASAASLPATPSCPGTYCVRTHTPLVPRASTASSMFLRRSWAVFGWAFAMVFNAPWLSDRISGPIDLVDKALSDWMSSKVPCAHG